MASSLLPCSCIRSIPRDRRLWCHHCCAVHSACMCCLHADGLGNDSACKRFTGEPQHVAGERRGSETQLEVRGILDAPPRSEEHTSELQSLMRISYAVFCLKKKNTVKSNTETRTRSDTRQVIQAKR